MEIAALIISILSIIVSFIVLFVELYYSKKINDINLEASYMTTIYAEHLIRNIPNARKYIGFPNNKLSGIVELQKSLNLLRQDSIYYKYSDESFYIELKNACQLLEDYIVNNEDKEMDFGGQADTYVYIEKSLQNIYAIVNKKYTNGHYIKYK